MDVIVTEVFSRWYIHLYEQIGSQIYAPAPDQLFQTVGQIATVLYEHSPPIVRTYYTILNSIPVQTDIIPVALAMLILYALFAVIVVTLRGLFRLIYGFIRLSIIISLLAVLACIVMQYSTAKARGPFDQYFYSSAGTLSKTTHHHYS